MNTSPNVENTEPVEQVLASVLSTIRQLDPPGKLANYIPELASVDPDPFGIAMMSVAGHEYRAGDATNTFTIQSISKAFVYAIAVERLGLDTVRDHVGVEPSGQPFDAINFDDEDRPTNPMINVGAITITSLIPGETAAERFELIREQLSAFAGRELEVDLDVYASESSTGYRNVALAALARSTGKLLGSIDEAADVYFRQCSIIVTSADLAVMGTTLACGGINPLTGQRVVSSQTARHTLSVMASCGMYDRSGDWLLDVGLPAKSGVGGGIVAVAPGRFGVGVFSPPLDSAGNSARGVAALKTLVEEYGLHIFNRPVVPVSPIERLIVSEERVAVDLRGEIDFVAAERVAFEVTQALPPEFSGTVAVDLASVTEVKRAGARLLRAMTLTAVKDGFDVEFFDPDNVLRNALTQD